MGARVSVVIPVYNAGPYLAACLESVLSQPLQDPDSLEVICVDDCSTDGSAEILTSFAARDPRVRILRTGTNSGVSAARNAGMDAARGEYIYFLDADDELAPDTLYRLWQCASENRLDGLFFDMTGILENPWLEEAYGHELLPRRGIYPDSAVSGREMLMRFFEEKEWSCYVQRQLWRRGFLEEERIRFPEGYIHEDEFFSCAAICTARRAMYLPVKAFVRRYHTGSIMTASDRKRHYLGYASAFLRLAAFLEEKGLGNDLTALIYLGNIRRMADGYAPVSFDDVRDDPEVRSLCLAEEYRGRPERAMIMGDSRIPDLSGRSVGRLYIYGAGQMGRYVCSELLRDGQMDRLLFEGFIVTEKGGQAGYCMGRPVISWEEYVPAPGDLVLVAVGSRGARREIAGRLSGAGIEFILV